MNQTRGLLVARVCMTMLCLALLGNLQAEQHAFFRKHQSAAPICSQGHNMS